MFIITKWLIVLAIVVVTFLLIRSKSVFDRLLALNIISGLGITFLTLYAVVNQNYMILDLSLTYAIMGYLGITLFSLFVIKGGREK